MYGICWKQFSKTGVFAPSRIGQYHKGLTILMSTTNEENKGFRGFRNHTTTTKDILGIQENVHWSTFVDMCLWTFKLKSISTVPEPKSVVCKPANRTIFWSLNFILIDEPLAAISTDDKRPCCGRFYALF